ncbi:hypothetical protein E1295_13275 [Nonomuraea mesophila]|uniref:GNAT-like C-terminal domain-containing protein n=1 Tax=Nonomuraea mesophila TaxID=2530382 RepID=A0A4R5FRL0_9ACTN|nr:hypothetical protein [Nonomuraea mesophila]TDE55774.1 hypothetical protein E1295_13275 [Nonomuraea mesophila]
MTSGGIGLARPYRFDNAETVPFVFGADFADPARLPRRTRLERAVADHLASGGTWYGRIDWLRF